MSFINKFLKVILGDKNEKEIIASRKSIQKILLLEKEFEQLSLDELRNKTVVFKNRIVDSTKEIQAEIDALKVQAAEENDFLKKDDLFEEIEVLDKKKYAQEEITLNELLPEAFMTIKETAKRFKDNDSLTVKASALDISLAEQKEYIALSDDKQTSTWQNQWDAAGTAVSWNMLHYDVQLIGGLVLHSGKIAEMQTGEGKTLVSTLPVYLNALPGRGVHVVTVNEYLSKRDAAWNGPIFEFLGLTVDCIDKSKPNSPQRVAAYKSDITYGTNNEFGFDYLRDNMSSDVDRLVQRELNYAIIDEVDSVLVDEARTPLIISGPIPQGDKQEYQNLKPTVEILFQKQKEELTKVLQQAKKLFAEGDKKEGGRKIYQVFRGLPKYKPLIKFLSEDGVKLQLQKTESYYLQDNKREMPKIDSQLLFVIDEKNNSVDLTDRGIEYLSTGNNDNDFFILPDIGTEIAEIEQKKLTPEKEAAEKESFYRDYAIKSERIHSLNQLVKAYTLFEKDVEYVVMEGQVKIVDEQTGRIMDGRRYSDGLHQALEAKEKVKIEAASQTYATITLQNFFRMYNKISGMTGTAVTEAAELWEIYKLDVIAIPTNKPIVREDKNDVIYKTQREKFNGIVQEILRLSREEKRPVLVGTTSVEISELLSRTLKINKIEHNVLNAKLHKKEAEIVQNAGKEGMVTIATNMAGRGTDIKLSPGALQAGGLAIVGTERHDSRRVDRQLRGRAGRQGDPGSSQFFVSMEDNLMRLFGSEKMVKWMDRFGFKEGESTEHGMLTNAIESAQKKVEENNFGVRKRLIDYDDVMNRQRKVIYKKRKNALYGDRIQSDLFQMIYDQSEEIIQTNKETSDYKNFEYELIKYFTMQTPVSEVEFAKMSERELLKIVYKAAEKDYLDKCNRLSTNLFPLIKKVYEEQSDQFKRIQVPFTDGFRGFMISSDLKDNFETEGKSFIRDFEKSIVLSLIDDHWKEHLREMDELKTSSQNASFEQKDPLVVYKQESFYLFKRMLVKLRREIISVMYKAEIPEKEKQPIRTAVSKPAPKLDIHTNKEDSESEEKDKKESLSPRKVVKIGRNDRVLIKNITTGEQKELKYKQAISLLEETQWVVEKVLD